jgi:S-DNA-T family DNA segregation ATPase FtsK/SpoIIIE
MSGAEKLLGRGDMLLKSPNYPQAKRIQSIFVSEEEVKAVADFLRKQEWPEGSDDGLDEIIESAQTSGSASMKDFLSGADAPDDQDPLYSEAKNLVIDSRRASTSYLQRRFRVGYSRAARLMDMLEDEGVIAPPDGAKPRAVLMTKEVDEALDTSGVPMVGNDK